MITGNSIYHYNQNEEVDQSNVLLNKITDYLTFSCCLSVSCLSQLKFSPSVILKALNNNTPRGYSNSRPEARRCSA